MAEGCIFCDIVEGKIPAELIYEDHLAIAIRDIAPTAPVHALVIPREHIATLDDASSGHQMLLGHLLLVAKEVAAKEGLGDGYRAVLNCGAEGGQSVDHIHVHVIGGRPLSWPPG